MLSRHSAILLRTALLLPFGAAFVAVAGVLACHGIGLDPHPRDMYIAAIGCLLASFIAIGPLFAVRGAPQQQVIPMGLVSTALHLFICMVLFGVLSMARTLSLTRAFEYWLLAFYWTTLLLIASCVIGVIKVAELTVTNGPVTNVPATSPKV